MMVLLDGLGAFARSRPPTSAHPDGSLTVDTDSEAALAGPLAGTPVGVVGDGRMGRDGLAALADLVTARFGAPRLVVTEGNGEARFALLLSPPWAGPDGAPVFVSNDGLARGEALAAGCRVAPHAALAPDVLRGAPLVYVLVETPHDVSIRLALSSAAVPVYAGPDHAVVIVAADRLATLHPASIMSVAPLGGGINAATTDAYLIPFPAHPKARRRLASRAITVLHAFGAGVLVAVPAGTALDDLLGTRAHARFLEPRSRRLDACSGDDPIWTEQFAANVVIAAHSPPTALTDDWSTLRTRIQRDEISTLVRQLSGAEPLGTGPQVSSRRCARATENAAVVTDLLAQFRALGGDVAAGVAHLTCGGPRHNVWAQLTTAPDQPVVIVSAHLDSIAEVGSASAPGADDDASGVAGVVAAARAVFECLRRHASACTVRFVLFNAEEDGLRGSSAYAEDLVQACAQVVGVYQMDMIGFRGKASPPWHLEVHAGKNMPERSKRGALALAAVFRELAPQVSQEFRAQGDLKTPQLYSSKAGDAADQHSDHSTLQSHCFAACLVCEDTFPDADDFGVMRAASNPAYHTSRDKDVHDDYAAAITRGVAASALLVARLFGT